MLGFFDAAYYLSRNPDVAEAVRSGTTTAEDHFQQFGRFENRAPNTFFDASHYLNNNPDVREAVSRGETTAYDHFVDFGAGEARDPSPLFDSAFYLASNPDVREAIENGETTAFEHFQRFGSSGSELRSPSPMIDLRAYVEANEDVAAAVAAGETDPLQHFLEFGLKEGRDLGNGIRLSDFQEDPEFNEALANGSLTEAFSRVKEVAPFLPSFQKPEDWTPPPDTPIPTDFTPPDGVKLIVPEGVAVPEGSDLGDAFQPVEAGEPGDDTAGGGGSGTTTPPPTPEFSVLATPQESTFSVGATTFEAGDVFSIEIAGTTVTYTTDGTEADADGLAAAVAGAINADPAAAGVVTATAGDGGEVTLTAVGAGAAFTAGSLSFANAAGGTDDQSVGAITTTTEADLAFSGNTTGTITAAIDGDNVATFSRDGITATATVDLDLITRVTLAAGQTLELPAAAADGLTIEGSGALAIAGVETLSTTHFARIAETIALTATGVDGASSYIGPGAWAGDLTFVGTATGGSDTVSGGAGNDSLFGGGGGDGISGEDGNDYIGGGIGNDGLGGGDGDDTVSGGDGDDTIVGGAGADSLLGDAGNDIFPDLEAGDTVDGGAGDDSYLVGDLAALDDITLSDPAGTDRLGLVENDTESTNTTFKLELGKYASTLAGIERLEVLDNGKGWYWWITASGDADLGGLRDFDLSSQTTGSNAWNAYVDLSAITSSDLVVKIVSGDAYGGGGSDRLTATGEASLKGGEGADTLEGGAGYDYYLYDSASEMTGDVITDTGDNELKASYSLTALALPAMTGVSKLVVSPKWGATDPIDVDLTVEDGDLQSLRSFDFRNVDGTMAFDASQTTVGLTLVSAASKSATLATGSGNDSITGGSQSDTIAGGEGADTLVGGSEHSDTYIFTSFSDYQQDTVVDAYYSSGNVVKIGGSEAGNLDLSGDDWIAELRADAGATWTTLALSNVSTHLKAIDLTEATGIDHVVDLTGNNVGGSISSGDGNDRITAGNESTYSSTMRISAGEGADEVIVVGRITSIDVGADTDGDTVTIKPGSGSPVGTLGLGSRGAAGLDLRPESTTAPGGDDGRLSFSSNPTHITEFGTGDKVMFDTGQSLAYAGTAALKETDSTLTDADGNTGLWDGTIGDGEYIVASWDRTDTPEVFVPNDHDATLVLYDADSSTGVEMRAIKIITPMADLSFGTDVIGFA